MSCYRMWAAVSFLVLGLWSCNAYATYGYSWAGGGITIYDSPELGEGLPDLSAYAYLLRDNDEDEQSASDPYNVYAEVGDDWSYGYAEMNSEGPPYGDTEASAEAWDGSYTKAIGRATAWVDFTTVGDGQMIVGIEGEYGLEAYAEGPGHWVHVDTALRAVLTNLTTGEESSFDFDQYADTADGDGYYFGDGLTGIVSVSFDAGDQGRFWLEAYSLAEASGVPQATVPAPGAVVLGSLGMGLVGWLRRRRSL